MNRADCRTAPATPGLLIIKILNFFLANWIFIISLKISVSFFDGSVSFHIICKDCKQSGYFEKSEKIEWKDCQKFLLLLTYNFPDWLYFIKFILCFQASNFFSNFLEIADGSPGKQFC